MKTWFKKITAVISAAAIALAAVTIPSDITSGTGLDIPAAAESVLDALPTGGLYEPDPIAITAEEAEDISEAVRADYEKAGSISDATASPLTGYDHSTDYFYDQLSSGFKTIWNDLEAACDAFMTSTVDLTTSKTSGIYTIYYLSEPVSVEPNTIKTSDVKSFQSLFKTSNPQYYFIYAFSYSYNPTTNYVSSITPTVIADCATYANRAKYNNAIKSTTLEWMPLINAKTTILDKELYICDLVKEFIEYDYDALPSTQDWHDQGLIGVFYDKLAVCAGYTASISYLCNAAGIDCFGVVSDDHAWNKINLYGTWYETDVTWYDSTRNNKWLNKSHNTIVTMDGEGHHDILTESYTTMGVTLPSCTSDTVYTVSSISVFTMPTKTVYGLGDSLDVSGGEVKLTLSNGSSVTIDMKFCKASGFSSASTGTKTVTLTFDGKTTTFSVTVKDNTPIISGISMYTLPTKTTFYTGDTVDVSGGVIKVSYSNGTSTYVNITSSMINTVSTAIAGTKTVTVSYEGFTTTYSITVVQLQVASISMSVLPKTNYVRHDTLSVTGGQIKVTYNNGDIEYVTLEESMISGFDTDTAGTRTVTVTYGGKTTSYTITVADLAVESIEIYSLPKTAYFLYEVLDVEGGQVKFTLNNGVWYLEDLKAEWVSGFSTQTTGSRTLTVAASGKTTSYNIAVTSGTVQSISLSVLPKTVYQQGEELDLTGARLRINYSSTRAALIDVTEDMISGFSTAEAGTKTVTVTYRYCVTTYTITVNALQALSIKISTLPKTQYFVHDELDVTDGKIEVSLNNGSTLVLPITEDMIENFSTDKAGTFDVTVKYGSLTATYQITVTALSISGISISTYPKTAYYLYEELDVTGGKIRIDYNNGLWSTFDMDADMILDFSTSEIGTKRVAVYAFGKLAYYNITVTKGVVTQISIKDWPKTEYYVGEAFDPADGTIRVYYDNGNMVIIPITSEMVTGFSSANPGGGTITVTYGGCSDTLGIVIEKASITNISMAVSPRMYYRVGETEYDPADGTLTVVYSDETVKSVPITKDMVTGFTAEKAGVYHVIITYSTESFEYLIQVFDISGISILDAPKTDYYIGDELDLTGGTIKASYGQAPYLTVDMNESMISGFSTETAGTKTVAVSYKGYTTTYDITVKKDTVSEITVKAPEKTTYIVGEELDVTGGTVTATHVSGKTKELPLENEMCSGFDSSKAANAVTVTVSYEGCTDTFDVKVIENAIKSIELTTLPKVAYFVGEELDVTGAVLTVTYANGSTESVAVTDQMISGFSSETAGEKTLTVTYGEKSVEFTIIVSEAQITGIEISAEPKTEYWLGEELDVTGGKILVHFSDNSTASVDMIPSMIEGFSTETAGTVILTVNYSGFTVIYTITVSEDKVTSIAVVNTPKTEYFVGEEADLTDGSIEVTYKSGRKEVIPITEEMIASFTTEAPGTVNVTVTYKDVTTYYTITVSKDDISSIELKTLPRTNYEIGDALDVSSGVIKVIYTSGKTVDVPMTSADITITGFTSAAAGEYTLTVNYEGCTTEYTITVSTAPVVTAIEISTSPKTAYAINDTLDVTGGKIKATYSDGSTKIVDITAEMVTGFTSATAGEHTLTVTYESCTTEYTITVSEAPVICNGTPYDDLYSALAAVKNTKDDVDILLSKSFVLTSKITIPTKATSITIRGTSRNIYINMKNASLTFNCPVTIDSIKLNNSKGEPIAITAKKSLTLNNAETGTLKVSGGDLNISGGAVVRGSVTVSVKTGTVSCDDSVIAGNIAVSSKNVAVNLTGDMLINGTLTTAGLLSVSGNCTVHGKFTPKGSIEINGELTAMWD